MNWYGLRSTKLPDVPVFYAPTPSILSKIIQIVRRLYPIIVIDGTPSNRGITKTILQHASLLLIPVLPSLSDLQTTAQLVTHVQEMQAKRKDILLCRFILNQSTRTNNNKEALVRLAQFPFPLLPYPVKNKVVFKRAYETGKGVIELKDTSIKPLYAHVQLLLSKIPLLQMLQDF